MKILLSLGKRLPHFSNGISTQGNLSLNVGAVGLALIHHLQANLATAHTLLMLFLQQTSFIPTTPSNFSFSQISKTWLSHVLISSSMTSIV